MTKFEKAKERLIAKQKQNSQKIEPKMVDIITALNCLGIEPDESCEGHPDKVTEPNVDYNEDTNLLEKRIKKALNFYPFIIITITNNQEKLSKLIDLLNTFYSNRNTPMKHRLIMAYLEGWQMIIRPHSGDISALVEDEKEKIKLYDTYHKEFTDFTEFLKTKINQ